MSTARSEKLLKAIRQDDATAVRQIIASAEENINQLFPIDNWREMVPITYAITLGKTQALSALLEAKHLQVNQINLEGEDPPLFLAMKNDQLECFKILLADPRVDINATGTMYKYTPLIASVSTKKKQFFQALLDSKRASELDVNKQCQDTVGSAIGWAAFRADLFYLQKLLRHPKIIIQDDQNHIKDKLDNEKNLSKAEDLRLLEEAVARGRLNANTNENPQPPSENKVTALQPISDETRPNRLLQAINDDNEEEIRRIITSKEENINKRFTIDCGDVMVPLTYAVTKGKAKALKALLEAKDIELNPKEVSGLPLFLAMKNDQLECFKILLADPRVDINATDTMYAITPLIDSVYKKKELFFKALLESKRKIDVNKSSELSTALECACKPTELFYLQALLRLPEITVPDKSLYGSDIQVAAHIRSKLDTAQNLSRTDDLRFLDQAIACGNPDQGKYKRRSGIFVAVAIPLIYTIGVIGIPLGFTRKPQETYEAFEKLHLDGLIDNISESTKAQVMAGMIGGVLLIALLVTAGILIKNNPPPAKESKDDGNHSPQLNGSQALQ